MSLSRRHFLQGTAGAAVTILVPFKVNVAPAGAAVLISPSVYGFTMDGYRMTSGEWSKAEIGQGNMDLEVTFSAYGSAVLFYAKGESKDSAGLLRAPTTGYQLELAGTATRLAKISDAGRTVLRTGPAVAKGTAVTVRIRESTYTVLVGGAVLLPAITDTSFYAPTAETYRRMYLRQLSGSGINSLKVTPCLMESH